MHQTIIALHLATAALCATIAVLATRSMLRRPRWQPVAGWSFVAFVTTVAVTSILRAAFPLLPRTQALHLVGSLLELGAAAMLAVVFVHAVRQRRVVPELVARMRRRADEYSRARRDYDRLLRHRIANPLAAVHGIALTLESFPDLDDERRRQLVSALVDASHELATVSIDPGIVGPEERGLRPRPVEVDEPCGVRRAAARPAAARA